MESKNNEVLLFGFTLRRVLAVFTWLGYDSAKSTLGEMWSTMSTLSGAGLADFGCDPRSSDSRRARQIFVR